MSLPGLLGPKVPENGPQYLPRGFSQVKEIKGTLETDTVSV